MDFDLSKAKIELYKSGGGIKKICSASLADGEKVLIDVKGLYSVGELEASGLSYWRL